MKFTTIAFAMAVASGANAFVQNSPRVKTSSIQGYLDDISGSTSSPKKGIVNYLDSIPTTPTRTAGAGIGSYLDSVNQACNGASAPTSECADAITDYMGALSTGDEPASSAKEGAQTIGNYLDSMLKRNVLQGGPGIPTYLSTVATGPERAGGAGIANYLDSVPSASALTASAPAVKVSLNHVIRRGRLCESTDKLHSSCVHRNMYFFVQLLIKPCHFFHMHRLLTAFIQCVGIPRCIDFRCYFSPSCRCCGDHGC